MLSLIIMGFFIFAVRIILVASGVNEPQHKEKFLNGDRVARCGFEH